jgi:hypothetical protein
MYSNVANGWLQHKVGKQQRERNLNSFEIAAIVKKGIVNQSKSSLRSSPAMVASVASSHSSTRPALGWLDAIALIVGIVIGAGVYELPALVAVSTAPF